MYVLMQAAMTIIYRRAHSISLGLQKDPRHFGSSYHQYLFQAFCFLSVQSLFLFQASCFICIQSLLSGSCREDFFFFLFMPLIYFGLPSFVSCWTDGTRPGNEVFLPYVLSAQTLASFGRSFSDPSLIPHLLTGPITSTLFSFNYLRPFDLLCTTAAFCSSCCSVIFFVHLWSQWMVAPHVEITGCVMFFIYMFLFVVCFASAFCLSSTQSSLKEFYSALRIPLCAAGVV